MINQKEFDHWSIVNDIPKETRDVIEQIRSSDPSRKVRSGMCSVSGRFPSRKMGTTIQFESHKNELPFIYELEHDPDVLEYYDQPPVIKLQYPGKNNRNQGALHTPDFFVIRKNSAEWVECKTEDDLLKLSVRQPNRFKPEGETGWSCPPGEKYAERFGLDYRLRSSSEINWKFQRNIEFLEDYYVADTFEVPEETVKKVCDIVTKKPFLTLKDLIEKVVDGLTVSMDDIYFLIAQEIIFVDIRSCLLTESESATVYLNRETFQAYSYVLRSKDEADERTLVPNAINITPNTEILWDGKGWKIINAGDRKITLVDERNDIVTIASESFKRLISSGSIRGIAGIDATTENQKALELLIATKESLLKTANYRAQIVCGGFESDDFAKIPERTLRDWKSKYRNAEEVFGNGYFGLIARTTKGNRNSKLPELSIELMNKAIIEKFETLEQKSLQSVYLTYKDSCLEAGVIAASYVTFCKRVKNRPKHNQVKKRKGRRASYSTEEFLWYLDESCPRHGERPFHIAHIDHTELDVELIDIVTGKNLGRPWLTIMIDAYSRRILAVYLTFQSPSKISCMMIVRECVRRHGRLPQILVVDGGKEFESVYFESFLASYGVTKKTRPPAKARFGSVIERLFGTVNKTFVHNLRGNTQITRNVRQVTKSNNPKNRAIWTLPELFSRLCEWAYEVYDETDHSSLHMSPSTAFAQGMLNSGERSHTLIAYDETFKLMTLPSTPKKTAKIDYQRGVKINRIFYWSDEFRVPGTAGKRVDVRFDPFDAGTAYAFVNGKWRECRSEHFQVFKGRTQREIYLATEILKKLNNGEVTVSKIAKFLKSIEAEEKLLLQRAIDMQQRPVLAAINSGETIKLESTTTSAESTGDTNSVVDSSFDEPNIETDASDAENDELEIYEDL